MNCLVTGGSGFIGKNLVKRLNQNGHIVKIYDRKEGNDILDLGKLINEMEGCNTVFHLAARADLRSNTGEPYYVYENNTVGTANVLEAMRRNKVKRIVFASSGSVYGEPNVFPTPEDAPFPKQTSIYAASKLAGEGLIQAYQEAFGIQGYIFRFVSNVGEHYSHGHVLDFYKKLKANPEEIQILGNGKQRKSYVYVGDTIEAIMTALQTTSGGVFNLGTDEYCNVFESLGYISERMGIKDLHIKTETNERGWVGDSPFIYLDCKKLNNLGWYPKLTIRQGIERTIDYFKEIGL